MVFIEVRALSDGGRLSGSPTMERESDGAADLPWAHLRLPPFPQIAVRVLQLANDENVQLHELSDMVSSDPVFAGEVLTLANSAVYSTRYPSSSIFQAISVLGAKRLQSLCVTVGARAYMGRSMSMPATQGLWRHNLACAMIARRLATAGFRDGDLAYTSGIVHDLGRMALVTIQPREYAHLLGTHIGTSESMLEQERQLFGWDHCETGQRLIAEWNLPEEFDLVVAGHHGVPDWDRKWETEELVKMSCRIADTIGFPAFPGCTVTAYGELLEEMPERLRQLFTLSEDMLSTEVGESIHALEHG